VRDFIPDVIEQEHRFRATELVAKIRVTWSADSGKGARLTLGASAVGLVSWQRTDTCHGTYHGKSNLAIALCSILVRFWIFVLKPRIIGRFSVCTSQRTQNQAQAILLLPGCKYPFKTFITVFGGM
jgi:hypothetical protein